MSMGSPLVRWLSLAVILVVAVGVLWFAAERTRHSTTPKEEPEQPLVLSEPITDAYADFSLGLLGREYRVGENLLLSPMSLHQSLSLLASGAEGETQKQLLELLGGGCTEEELRENNLLLSSLTTWDREENAYALSSSLWLEGSRQFDLSFVEKAAFYFPLFSQNNAEAAQALAVEAVGALPTEATRSFLLVSTASFHGTWTNPIEETFFQASSFTTTDGEELPVVLLPTEEARYLAGEGYSGFIKSLYFHPEYSFVALVPDRKSDMSTLLGTLTGAEFRRMVKDGDAYDGDHLLAFMPAFEMQGSLSLREALTSLGISDAFDPKQADFSPLLIGRGKSLILEDVFHRVRVRVDGAGCKGTVGTVLPMSASRGTPVETQGEVSEENPADGYHLVFAERPFLFAIVDADTGVPLILGVCERPVTPAGVKGF